MIFTIKKNYIFINIALIIIFLLYFIIIIIIIKIKNLYI